VPKSLFNTPRDRRKIPSFRLSLTKGPLDRNRASQQRPNRQRIIAFEPANFLGTKPATDKNLFTITPRNFFKALCPKKSTHLIAITESAQI
jgi:hypothetical protein